MRGHLADSAESGVRDGANEDVGDECSERTCASQRATGSKEETGSNGTGNLVPAGSAQARQNHC